jgi:hypothetical protein
MASQELEGPQRLLPPLKGEHLNWAQTIRSAPISPTAGPLNSHKWFKISSSPDTPTKVLGYTMDISIPSPHAILASGWDRELSHLDSNCRA